MTNIVLTKDEVAVIELQLAEKIDIDTVTEEQKVLLMGIIERAEALMDELNAYEELDDNLIAWYYNKYKSQQI